MPKLKLTEKEPSVHVTVRVPESMLRDAVRLAKEAVHTAEPKTANARPVGRPNLNL